MDTTVKNSTVAANATVVVSAEPKSSITPLANVAFTAIEARILRRCALEYPKMSAQQYAELKHKKAIAQSARSLFYGEAAEKRLLASWRAALAHHKGDVSKMESKSAGEELSKVRGDVDEMLKELDAEIFELEQSFRR